jgi:hypothetical protein
MTNTTHNVFQGTNISLLFLLHVSARLGHYHGEHEEYEEVT